MTSQFLSDRVAFAGPRAKKKAPLPTKGSKYLPFHLAGTKIGAAGASHRLPPAHLNGGFVAGTANGLSASGVPELEKIVKRLEEISTVLGSLNLVVTCPLSLTLTYIVTYDMAKRHGAAPLAFESFNGKTQIHAGIRSRLDREKKGVN